MSELVQLLAGRRVVALTGAGCSTESGIPDYRGPKTRHKARNPIQFQDFMRDEQTQARYWARSYAGWPKMAAAKPNSAHKAIAQMEWAGPLVGVITQNVDRLHRKAGSQRVVELHGALEEVRCLDCGMLEDRSSLQRRLSDANPGWRLPTQGAAAAPDGDADLPEASVRRFEPVSCACCAGTLKPDVVFFGENVPPAVTAAAWRLYEEAEVLLVLGSSLAVFSGYRFVRRATQDGRDVAIVNLGTSRGDTEATICVRARLGALMPALAARLNDQGR